MNDTVRRTTFAMLLAAAAAPSAVRAQFRDEPDPTGISVSGKTTETVLIAWPTFSYSLARTMIAKYGQPAESHDGMLVWFDNGPWKKTVVYRDAAPGKTFKRDKGRIEQSAAYRMPGEKVDALERFDKRVAADLEESRLTARSDSETVNFLMLNLADDVINGRRSPAEASLFRTKLVRLADAGKSSSYLDGLMFASNGQALDPENPD